MHRDSCAPHLLPEDPEHAAASAAPQPLSAEDWERPPARAPLLRWHTALSAVLLVLVAAAAWWAVSWLTSPAPPTALPGRAVAGAAPPGPGEEADSAGTVPPAEGVGAGPVPPGPSTPAVDGPVTPPPGGRIRVHVVGEVRRPGVVELDGGARVADAVRAAGGETGRARSERINLAAPLSDGDQVLMPSASTPAESLAAAAAGPGGADAVPSAGKTAGAGARAGASPGAGTVDLNTADAAQLQTLPGVGPATAEKIIAHREGVGPFTGLQDLDAVPGIGPAALERLRDRVSW